MHFFVIIYGTLKKLIDTYTFIKTRRDSLGKKSSHAAVPLKVVTNEKGGAVGEVVTIIC